MIKVRGLWLYYVPAMSPCNLFVNKEVNLKVHNALQHLEKFDGFSGLERNKVYLWKESTLRL